MLSLRRFQSSEQRLLALLFVIGVFAVGVAPSADGDVWWHLAAGREIWQKHALIYTDSFSVSAAGRPWVDAHWLFQLGAFGLYSLGGLRLLVLAKCALVVAGSLVLLDSVVRRAGMRATAWFAAAQIGALFLARDLLLVRPVIVTLVFLAVFFSVLERHRVRGQARLLFTLPVLQVLWANFQGLSALGPALVLAYACAALATRLVGERRWFPFEREPLLGSGRAFRALFLAGGGCVAASACTPYGLAALVLPLRLLGRLDPGAENVFSANVVENVPPLSLDRLDLGQFFHVRGFIALLVLCFVLPGRRRPLSHVLVALALTALGLAANRNILLLYWLGTPLAAMHSAPALRRLMRWAEGYFSPRAIFSIACLPMAPLLTVALAAAAREPPLSRPAPFRAPTASGAILAERPDGRAVFAADHFGDYLIWALGPKHRPYMDTRLILRSADEFSEFLGLVDYPERFDAFAEREDIGYVLLPTVYPDRYLGLLAHVHASKGWKLLFTNGTEALFARKDDAGDSGWDLGALATTERILREQARDLVEAPRALEAARLALATLDLAVGELDAAERVLARTTLPEACLLRAKSRLARGDLAGARLLGEGLLQRAPRDRGAESLLALVSLAEGRPREATARLRRVLSADPYDIEAAGILRQIEEHQRVAIH